MRPYPALGKQLNAKKPGSPHSLSSSLPRIDAHVVHLAEYDELPELDEAMLARATVNRGGRPLSTNLRRLLSIRLPADVIDRWKQTGRAGGRVWLSG